MRKGVKKPRFPFDSFLKRSFDSFLIHFLNHHLKEGL